MAKVEMLCRDEDVQRIIEVVREHGCTHRPAMALSFVASVEIAVKICAGEEGEGILQV